MRPIFSCRAQALQAIPLMPNGVFRRRRKPARLKALAVALYHAGLSLRKARDLLRSLGYAVSHKGLEGLRLGAFMAAIGRRAREAFWPMKKVRGGQAYVWAARLPNPTTLRFLFQPARGQSRR